MGHSVHEIFSDGRLEFNNRDVMVGKAGISHRIAIENRTNVESAMAMLHSKNLPEKLWAEAVNTAVYILNRSGPSSIDGKSPRSLLYKMR